MSDILRNAWRVHNRVCDAAVAVRLDGVTISIPGHPEVQIFITAYELRSLAKAVDEFDGLNLGTYRRDVIMQGGGVTTKVATAEKLEAEGFVAILETVRGNDVRKFDLDPARAGYAARYVLTDDGEQIRHMLLNGGMVG